MFNLLLTILSYLIGIPLSIAALFLIYRIIFIRPNFPPPENTYVVKPKGWNDYLFGQIYRMFVEQNGTALREWLAGAEKEGKDVIAFEWTPALRYILPLHEEDLHYLLCGEGSPYVVKHKDYRKLGELLGLSGLITITDPKVHAHQRRLIAPAFSTKPVTNTANYVIPKYSALLHQTIKKELSAQQQEHQNTSSSSTTRKPRLSLNRLFDKFALDIIVEGSFSTLKSIKSGIDIGKAFEKMSAAIMFGLVDFLPTSIASRLPIEKNRVFSHYRPQIWQAADEMADKSIQQQENGEIRPGQEKVIDFLSREKDLTRQQLRDHLVHLLTAGHETTSKALTWAVIYLSRHPKVQQKLLEELEEAVALNSNPTLDDLTDCKYLEMVIKEVLRLAPSAPQVGRETTAELVLPHSGVKLPKGMRILLSMFLIHRRESVYGEDADEFRPERWEDSVLNEKQEKFGTVWMPFLPPTHSRNCIGSSSAMATLKIGLAALVRSFKLSYPEEQEFPKMIWKITLMPKPDPEIIMEPRNE